MGALRGLDWVGGFGGYVGIHDWVETLLAILLAVSWY